MLLSYMKSKIHRATVTKKNLAYDGSIEIDKELIEKAGLAPYEQVHVLNLSNGQRFVTYVIEGEAGTIGLAGPAARLGEVGDLVIIIAYAQLDESDIENFVPKVIHVDANNRVL